MSFSYSSAQIAQYLEYVGLPASFHPDAANPVPRDYTLLETLHIHQISTVPYENLSLHYKHPATITNAHNHHTTSGAYMSLDPPHLFDKFVTRGYGRGGYCFQVVTFFAHILRGMGFKHVYTAQARIRLRDPKDGVPSGLYVGFRHATNIVTLEDGSQWSLDVSFGGDGPIRPLPLISGQITPNIGCQQLRFIKDHISEQYDKTNPEKLWIYQYRNGTVNADGTDKDWNSYYAFAEIEYTAADLEIANWYTSQFPDSFQTKQVIVVKFLSEAIDKHESKDILEADKYVPRRIFGKIMLASNILKKNTGGKTEILKTCLSDVERIQTLREYFGIQLFPEEVDGIVGGITELHSATGQD